MLEHVLPGSAIISGIAEEEKRTRQRPRGAAVPFRGEEFARVDIHRPSPWLCGRSGCWRWRAVRAPQFSPGVLASVKGRQGQGCSWVTALGVLASRLLPPGTPGLGPVRGRGKQEEGAGGGRRSGQGREDGPLVPRTAPAMSRLRITAHPPAGPSSRGRSRVSEEARRTERGASVASALTSHSQTRLPRPCSGPSGSPRDSSETGLPNPGPVRGPRKPKHSEASSAFSPEHSRLDLLHSRFSLRVIRGQRYRKMGCRKTLMGKVSAMDVGVTMCGEIVSPRGGRSRDQKGRLCVPSGPWPSTPCI